VRLAILWLVSVAAVSNARTLQGVLGDAQEAVGLRPAPPFAHFASHVAESLTAPSFTSATTAALAGIAAIDATEATLGPMFLDHAETVGAGVTSGTVASQRSFAQGSLFGQPFNQLGLDTPPVLLKRTPTGQPGSPALLGIRLRYDLDVHVWATAIAVTHGFTDDVDGSVVLPIIHTALACGVFARVVRATGPNGGAFMPVHHAPTAGGFVEPVDATGVGDLVARGKYHLGFIPPPWSVAVTMEVQFPTGNPEQLHGTGDYWLTPGLDVALPLKRLRAELDATASLDVDVTNAMRSQALYGTSASIVLWPRHLAAIVEFMGQSQLETTFRPHDTDVLVLTPQGIAPDPLLGLGWSQRLDQFNFAFGLRAILGHGIMVFANGVVPLNRSVGVRPQGVVPTLGLGAAF